MRENQENHTFKNCHPMIGWNKAPSKGGVWFTRLFSFYGDSRIYYRLYCSNWPRHGWKGNAAKEQVTCINCVPFDCLKYGLLTLSLGHVDWSQPYCCLWLWRRRRQVTSVTRSDDGGYIRDAIGMVTGSCIRTGHYGSVMTLTASSINSAWDQNHYLAHRT